MKKFKLKANEMLHRNELKSVFGGGGGTCYWHSECPTNERCTSQPVYGEGNYPSHWTIGTCVQIEFE